jgi:predicted O-methyltransferase YrrM
MDERRKSKFLHYLGRLTAVSPARFWALLSKPQLIPVKLTAPEPVSSVDAILSLYPNLRQTTVAQCRLEFLGNIKFFGDIDKKMVEKRKRRTEWRAWDEFLYMVVRFCRPETVIETGVFDGRASAVILLALDRNSNGKLISIDLPAYQPIEASTDKMKETTLPPNCQPGWLIPNWLIERHRLLLGESRELLPELLSGDYPRIDIFLHDSLHTFECQYFEYTTVWPHLSKGGILLSDDIFWSSAFHKFSREKHKGYLRLHYDFGVVMK